MVMPHGCKRPVTLSTRHLQVQLWMRAAAFRDGHRPEEPMAGLPAAPLILPLHPKYRQGTAAGAMGLRPAHPLPSLHTVKCGLDKLHLICSVEFEIIGKRMQSSDVLLMVQPAPH